MTGYDLNPNRRYADRVLRLPKVDPFRVPPDLIPVINDLIVYDEQRRRDERWRRPLELPLSDVLPPLPKRRDGEFECACYQH